MDSLVGTLSGHHDPSGRARLLIPDGPNRRAVFVDPDQPDEALNYLRDRFKTIDPPLLDAAWKVVSQAHAKDLRVTTAELENSEKVNLVSKLLDPKDKLASYDGLWTDEYVK